MMVADTLETIVAVASAAGGAARGMVRITGSDCLRAVEGLFEPKSAGIEITSLHQSQRISGSITLGPLLGRVPADVLLWPGTRSYTRQPSAEIHTLGSPPLLDAILVRLCEHGARIARPGEFTLRAFLAGRIDLTQAEAVLGVIDARNSQELSAALAQLAGGLAGPLHELRDRLLDLLAHLEAGLDFVEEEIEFISREELVRQLDDAAARIQGLAEQMQRRATTSVLPRVVLSGPPNVGKSSLFNALCGSDAAIVSDIAGTTRDYVARPIRCGRVEVELIDTAGTDPASAIRGIEAAAQGVSGEQARQAAVVLECRDALESLPAPAAVQNERTMTVVTKCDRLTAGRLCDRAIWTSSRSGQGIEELRRAIEAAVFAQEGDANVVAGTAARCRESLFHAAESLRRARDAATPLGEEFVAAEVRAALDELGRVAGAVYTDDVLDRIFSRFCIGK